MLTSPFHRIMRLPLWLHAVAAVGAIALFQGAKAQLDESYAASKHPVDYMTGQTGFDGQKIKDYYASMADAGTLDVYVKTQIIDFGFIAAMACLGLFVCTLFARLSRDGSIGRRIGVFAGLSVLVGALCDTIENGISFVMLTNPASFANWLAVPYSGFASVKFALITLGMLGVIISLVLMVVGRVMNKPKIG